MVKQTKIQIINNDINISFTIEADITKESLYRIEKQLDAIITNQLSHRLRGRITSINMSLYMLEQVIPPASYVRFQLLKKQVEDLARIVEDISS